jgi:high-affinity nickel permease
MNITLVSIVVALLVGAIEALSIVAGQLHLAGGVCEQLAGFVDRQTFPALHGGNPE